MSDNGTTPKAALNLDALEREGGTRIPFDVVINGRRFVMADPKEIDWQDLLVAMRNPVMFIRMILPPDDHRDFFAAKIPSWKMDALIVAYQQHYGLPDPGEANALPR